MLLAALLSEVFLRIFPLWQRPSHSWVVWKASTFIRSFQGPLSVGMRTVEAGFFRPSCLGPCVQGSPHTSSWSHRYLIRVTLSLVYIARQ
ncbi:hypothetical protein ACN38_g7682 [Penicillium nordicum]|uniref:Uncharacterized protein n=1 Tax=Penicillium nordicum TaxID=229535 RepID=A0A0M9WEE1_9EURO|nr:hypothetical protein ACN38_g7682 [Penicillium nordicum]